LKDYFFDIPEYFSKKENSGYSIISVPFDLTSTWQKGADKAPKAILEASKQIETYDIETDYEAYKNGIYTDNKKLDISNSQKMINSVTESVSYYLENNKFPIILGGEHSVAIGAVKAVKSFYNDITVLQLDAHSDLRNEYYDSKYNHACTMARIKEISPIVQAGIRSMDVSEKKIIKEGRIFFAKDIYNSLDWINKVLSLLSKNVYITIDLDVFDPSIIPSTGTPEPGGLDWYTVLKLLKEVCLNKNLVGFDVCELCPGENKSSDFLAAKLIYKIITYHSYYKKTK
jgi:agmatinase